MKNSPRNLVNAKIQTKSKMVKLSELKLIKTPEQFFSADKILFFDVVEIDPIKSPDFARSVQYHKNTFAFDGRLCLVLPIKGSPANFYIKVMRGIPYLLNGFITIIKWDGGLLNAINMGKIYDFSDHYKNYPGLEVPIEYDTTSIIGRLILSNKHKVACN